MRRYRQLVRVLTLARYLSGRRRTPQLRELARTFGVHERTVRRDLEALEDAQWPVPPRTLGCNAWRND